MAMAACAAGVALAAAACSAPSTSGSPSAAASQPQVVPASAPALESATTPAPGEAAAVASLAPGFPQKLIPLMPKASLKSSSVDKNSSPASAALVATIPAPATAVFTFYAKAFAAQGFKAVPGEAVGGTKSRDFIRANGETANISVVEEAGASTFTVGANVAAGSLK
ncbi:hypothetical protein BIU82_18115 [Arthrobacter sp. SW1]|nr:hypothetical protein [Arthrobacter sp. SW1]OFI38344.1 hypothetical protein BIU82_18115 [Arthrobacter sp. SW1]